MAWLISRAELARKAGVSRAAITQACKGQLAGACDGPLVDLDHESVRGYLKARGVDVPARARPKAPPTKAQPAKKAPATRRRSDGAPTPKPRRARKKAPSKEAPSPPAPERPLRAPIQPSEATAEDIEAYAHLPLVELVELFGDAAAFKEWLASLKLIEEVREKSLKNDETEGKLISRELVATHVFGAIESSHRRLLGDSAKTIARLVYGLAKSGAPVEKAEGEVRKVISSQLQPAKETAARVVRNA